MDVIGLRSRVNVILSGAGLQTKGIANGLRFVSALGSTAVTAVQDAEASAEGRPVIRAAVTTSLHWKRTMLNTQQLAVINSLASLSALVKDEESGGYAISTRVNVRGEMAKPGAVLVAAAAMLQSDSLISALHLLDDTSGQPPHHAGSDQSIAGLGADLAHAQARLRDDGILTFRDAGGLTAVLPWENHTTSLLELSGTMSHPLLGRGLTYRLRLPQVWSDPKAVASLANTLNDREMSKQLPAAPGAWSISGEGDAPCFRGFIPTFCYSPGMALLVVDWMRKKHERTEVLIKDLQPTPAPARGRVRRALAKLWLRLTNPPAGCSANPIPG